MRTLSITINDSLYDNLKHAVPARKISKFVSEAVEEKLNRKREALYQAYLEARNDPQREKELKVWDEIGHEDWEPETTKNDRHP